MADRWDLPPLGPGAAPEKWLLRIGFVGLLLAAPGVAVGCFNGFQDDTEASAFAWVMTFLGGLVTVLTAWAGAMFRLAPEPRRKRRRRAAALRSRQAPLPAGELSYEALREAAVRSTAGDAEPKPPAPVTAGREPLVWWRDRNLLTAFDLPLLGASMVVTVLGGFAGVLHIFGGTTGRGYFFFAVAPFCLLGFVSKARDARAVARLAVREQVRPMRWLLLREPDAGEAYLLLYRADGDPNGTPPMLLRLARRQSAQGLPPAGVAEVHGLLRPFTVLVPWIDGTPMWTRHPVTALDLTTEPDRARLTYLKGAAPLGR
ncbi:hypothetical protein AB0I51_46940 [Streptomyces sp. NPDC050549]|uniref:hypothetical protein n=1 Tax=Streptomyces sp. NPDC050549 TaxID=3155406 RepID=UPI003441CE50